MSGCEAEEKEAMPKTLTAVLATARAEISALTGLKLSSTVDTASSDGGWRLAVEMVEKPSIPDSMDVLATYELLVDDEGHVREFKRKGMRKRMEAVSGQAA